MGAVEIPDHDIYKYDTTDGACSKSPPEELDPTPDAAPDHYLNASVVLPRGDKFSRGKVIGCKRDNEDNLIGRANEKKILDTRRYEVDYGDGEIAKLTANVIAESMYAQVDLEGNGTLLMNCMVDYKCN